MRAVPARPTANGWFTTDFFATDSVGHIFKISTDGGTPVELAAESLCFPRRFPRMAR